MPDAPCLMPNARCRCLITGASCPRPAAAAAAAATAAAATSAAAPAADADADVDAGADANGVAVAVAAVGVAFVRWLVTNRMCFEECFNKDNKFNLNESAVDDLSKLVDRHEEDLPLVSKSVAAATAIFRAW